VTTRYWLRATAGLIAIAGIAVALPARAGVIERVEAGHARGLYTVHASAVIDVPLDAVWAIATDHDGLYRLSKTITASRLIERHRETGVKRRIDVHTCILLFCVDFVMTELVRLPDKGDIMTSIVPEESDFSSGESHWRMTAIDDSRTRIELQSSRAPRFWIPPLIGPLIIKQKMRREMTESILRIEDLARALAVSP
jgi:hypothetical protein